MKRIFALFLLIPVFYNHEVTSQWVVKYPIIKEDAKAYILNLKEVIQDNSCINPSGQTCDLATSVLQIQKAIQLVNVTTNIENNLVKGMENEKRFDYQQYLKLSEYLYESFLASINRITQLPVSEYGCEARRIRDRILKRRFEWAYLHDRVIQIDDPSKSIFAEARKAYGAMDRVLWCGAADFQWDFAFFHIAYAILLTDLRMFIMDVADNVLLTCYIKGDTSLYPPCMIDEDAGILEGLDEDVQVDVEKAQSTIFTYGLQYIEAIEWAMIHSRKNSYQCSPCPLIRDVTYIELSSRLRLDGPSLPSCDLDMSSLDMNSWLGDSCASSIPMQADLEEGGDSGPEILMADGKTVFCPNDDPAKDTLRRISLMEQTSDIDQNKIVTNLRFVRMNNAIHIQIAEGQLDPLNDFMICGNESWKEIPQFSMDKMEDLGMSFDTREGIDIANGGTEYVDISSFQRILNLDDIILPFGYIVTGIKFALAQDLIEAQSPIEIQVRATLYDAEANNLIVYLEGKPTSFWVTSKMMPVLLIPGYDRPRTEYELQVAGYPAPLDWKMLDSTANQYVKFTRSEVEILQKKRTIPFFDGRPTFSEILQPLGGVTLFLKGSKKAAIYATLDTLTYPVVQYVRKL